MIQYIEYPVWSWTHITIEQFNNIKKREVNNKALSQVELLELYQKMRDWVVKKVDNILNREEEQKPLTQNELLEHQKQLREEQLKGVTKGETSKKDETQDASNNNEEEPAGDKEIEIDRLKAILDKAWISYHHKAGLRKLTQLVNQLPVNE